MTSTIGKRLRTLREQRGLTVRQCAQAVGVPLSTYREWEYGRAIQGEPYAGIAKLLGVSLHELLTGEAPCRSEAIEKLQLAITALKDLENYLLSCR